MDRRHLIAGWTVGALMLVGCGSGAAGSSAEARIEREPESVAEAASGSALPRLWRHDSAGDGVDSTALVGGTLAYDSAMDCFLLESGGRRYPVVWPAGTTPSEGPAVQLPGGQTVHIGDSIGGGGGAGAPAPDEFDIPEQCLPETGEVIVFNVNEQLTVTADEDGTPGGTDGAER